jgi:hypothetical protein
MSPRDADFRRSENVTMLASSKALDLRLPREEAIVARNIQIPRDRVSIARPKRERMQ